MKGRFDPENPYTKAAIQNMQQIKSNPANARFYVQTAAAYAAIAQAIELEELNTLIDGIGGAVVESMIELRRIPNLIIKKQMD